METLLQLAQEAARAGAAEALVVRQRDDFVVRLKADRTPVTEADERSADAVARKLYDGTGYQIRSEDFEADWYEQELVLGPEAPDTWVIDPLDGTVAFVNGQEPWGVCISLIRQAEIALGVVYLPTKDEMYYATRGGGAWCNGRRLSVSLTTSLAEAVTSVTTRNERNAAFYDWTVQQPVGTLRDLFAASVKQVALAAGDIDLALSRPGGATCEWDSAPARIIVEEAGGVVTGFHGEPLHYLQPDPKNYLGYVAACTPALHAAAMKITAGWPVD